MRIKRRAKARWEGTVPNRGGTMSGRSGALDVPFSLRSRVEDTLQTNPEELIGAAHAGCFSMSRANLTGCPLIRTAAARRAGAVCRHLQVKPPSTGRAMPVT